MGQMPSQCRIVKYRDNDGNIHPAIITSVENTSNVNLHVMMDGGGTKWVKGVPHNQLLDEANTWAWPVLR
jgi:hypothetical protein